MRTLILTALGLLVLASTAHTQESESSSDTTKYWEFKGDININFSQVALQNWTGGGQNSISAAGVFSGEANYQKAKNSWENSLEVGYGVLRQGENETFRKSDDYLNLSTKYFHKLNDNFEVSGILDFRTAMTKGYNYFTDDQGEEQRELISDFMAPGYLISSVGLDYIPSENVTVTLSPITGKTTFLLNSTLSNQEGGAYGVKEGNQIRQEFGSNLHIALKGNPFKNVTYKTDANFFSSYKNPSEIDVNWRAEIQLKVNEFLATTITANLIYDEDIAIEREDGSVGPAVQFKEVLAVGLNYTLVGKDN